MQKDKYQKKSVSFPTDILLRIEEAAGDNVSGWITQACRERLDTRTGPPDIFARNILVDLVVDTLGKPTGRQLAFLFEQTEGGVDQTAELQSILFAYVESKRREQILPPGGAESGWHAEAGGYASREEDGMTVLRAR